MDTNCEMVPGTLATVNIEEMIEAAQEDFPGDDHLPRVRNARRALRQWERAAAPLLAKASDRPFSTLADGIKFNEIPF